MYGDSMLRPLVVCGLVVALGGCFQPMKASDGHLEQSSVPPPSASIPTPVQTLPALPLPKPAAKLETFSVTVHNVPAQELLFALARDANLNVDIHPGITGTVSLNALDQTLPQLLDRISRQVDMRYELNGPNLMVMPDSPFLRIYKVDYVNMSREAEGKISASGQITSTSASGGQTSGASGGSNTANSSTMTITNRSTNQFWTRLEQNVRDILRETDKILPAPATASATPSSGPASAVSSLVNQVTGTATAPAQPSVTFREAASVIANPEAGVLSIRATARQHERLQEFLDQVLVSAKRHVLIEATIVEVQLSNDYQQGIDWAVLSGSAGFQLLQGGLYRDPATTPGLQPPIPLTGLLPADPTHNLQAAQYNSSNFRATLRLLESFGNVRVLSSPRISVINNQTAVLKVVDNLVYFNVTAETNQNESTSLTTFTTTPQTVSVGFIMNVTPQIGEDDSVLLNVKPTIRRLIRMVPDPNPTLAREQINNFVPEIRERELESMLKVVNGQTAVMGGLIQDELANNTDTLPGVGDIPFLGNLFTNKNNANSKTELVIFLRPVVIRDPSINGDYREYRTMLPGDNFMREPHPARARTALGSEAAR